MDKWEKKHLKGEYNDIPVFILKMLCHVYSYFNHKIFAKNIVIKN